MEILLTLPEPFANYIRKHRSDYHGITDVFSDPARVKLGSGGGTVNVLWNHFLNSSGTRHPESFKNWLSGEKRIIIHADGQSRRLPAYAPFGKSFLPFPVFKWGRGQHIRQTLFDVQKPLLESILKNAPEGMNTLIVSGDALVYAKGKLPDIPQADVVCAGIWTQPEVAVNHGVFITSRHDPSKLEFMLQKPSIEQIQELMGDHLYLLDSGIWLLSDAAVEQLFISCGWDSETPGFKSDIPGFYDLYSEFGKTLGDHPMSDLWNPESGQRRLSTRILIPEEAEFYHFGSNHDLLKSTSELQNRVLDQRDIWHKKIKPSPDIFIQNSVTEVKLSSENKFIWIENSCISAGWRLTDHHILTGIPQNSWNVDLPPGACLDFVPIGKTKWCLRFYDFNDRFTGMLSNMDIYDAEIFPVFEEKEITSEVINWLIIHKYGVADRQDSMAGIFFKRKRLSCSDLIRQINHKRVFNQLEMNLAASLPLLAANFRHSIFYQLDLSQLAAEFLKLKLPLPPELPLDSSPMTRIHDSMFRTIYHKKAKASANHEANAFSLLREKMMEEVKSRKLLPVLNLQADQILWGRSPVRLDLAGGWTDTPPNCILFGGKVLNMAVELNGQPPLQVFIRPGVKPEIVIHSIDLGVRETIRSFNDLQMGATVGSAFSIPKAALMLSGFHPDYSSHQFQTLNEQLIAFGGGFDISLMVAVPKGSGLGTSSILAATLLGGLSEFCNLKWDRHEIAYRTLILEQMLTTGGGWQDQFGGIFEGVKLVESIPGFTQKPTVKWASDHLFTNAVSKDLILLYYTGINRVAKVILRDIVRGMFLNSAPHLAVLTAMKQHACNTFETMQNHDWEGLCKAIGYSWELNQQLDSGTNTPAISLILNQICDYASSYKLLGAGGGGYLLIFAKDLKAAGLIRSTLEQNPPNHGARFVDWEISKTGLRVSRS